MGDGNVYHGDLSFELSEENKYSTKNQNKVYSFDIWQEFDFNLYIF